MYEITREAVFEEWLGCNPVAVLTSVLNYELS